MQHETILTSHFSFASPFLDASLCALASPLTLTCPCTLTYPLQLLSPDVPSLCVQPFPMEHFASSAICLFPIPPQLTSLSQCPSTYSSTTAHYITVHPRCRSSCLCFSSHHTHFRMRSLLPHHEAASEHCTLLFTGPGTFQKLPRHIPSPNFSLPQSSIPYHSLIIPSQHLCSHLPRQISIRAPAGWKKKYN